MMGNAKNEWIDTVFWLGILALSAWGLWLLYLDDRPSDECVLFDVERSEGSMPVRVTEGGSRYLEPLGVQLELVRRDDGVLVARVKIND